MRTMKDFFDVLEGKGAYRKDLFGDKLADSGSDVFIGVDRNELLSLYFEYRMQADGRLHGLLKDIVGSIDDLRNVIGQGGNGEKQGTD